MTNGISVRVSNNMKQEIELFTEEEKLEQVSEAARKLLAMGLEEWRKERALKLLSEGKITLSKAAKISKISVWEMVILIKEKGIVWNKNQDYILSDLKKRL